MNELTEKQQKLIYAILTLSKQTFFQVSGLKRFQKNDELKEKLKEIEELELIFGNENNQIYYKNIEEV